MDPLSRAGDDPNKIDPSHAVDKKAKTTSTEETQKKSENQAKSEAASAYYLQQMLEKIRSSLLEVHDQKIEVSASESATAVTTSASENTAPSPMQMIGLLAAQGRSQLSTTPATPQEALKQMQEIQVTLQMMQAHAKQIKEGHETLTKEIEKTAALTKELVLKMQKNPTEALTLMKSPEMMIGGKSKFSSSFEKIMQEAPTGAHAGALGSTHAGDNNGITSSIARLLGIAYSVAQKALASIEKLIGENASALNIVNHLLSEVKADTLLQEIFKGVTNTKNKTEVSAFKAAILQFQKNNFTVEMVSGHWKTVLKPSGSLAKINKEINSRIAALMKKDFGSNCIHWTHSQHGGSILEFITPTKPPLNTQQRNLFSLFKGIAQKGNAFITRAWRFESAAMIIQNNNTGALVSWAKFLKSAFSAIGAGVKQGQNSLEQMATILQERGNIAATKEQQITTQIMQLINAFAHCYQAIDSNVGGGR